MNKGLKIACITIMIILALGYFGMQVAQPKRSYEEVVVEDKKEIEQVNQLAQVYLKDFFDISLPQDEEWEEQLILNQGKDENSPNVLAYSAKNKGEDLEEGSINFYGLIIEEKTKSLRGIIYQCITNAPILELTDEEVQKRSEEFLLSKGIVPAGTVFSLDTIQSDEQTPQLRLLTLKTGKDTYAISYHLQLDDVMYFECIPNT